MGRASRDHHRLHDGCHRLHDCHPRPARYASGSAFQPRTHDLGADGLSAGQHGATADLWPYGGYVRACEDVQPWFYHLYHRLGGLWPLAERYYVDRLAGGAGAGRRDALGNAMAIITEVFPAKQRGQAMGINAITWGAGSVLGPVLGGIILAVGSWRWIFLVNLPIGIVATLLAYLLLHDIAPNPKGERFDLLGALLFSVGLVALLLAITSGSAPAGSRRQFWDSSRWR